MPAESEEIRLLGSELSLRVPAGLGLVMPEELGGCEDTDHGKVGQKEKEKEKEEGREGEEAEEEEGDEVMVDVDDKLEREAEEEEEKEEEQTQEVDEDFLQSFMEEARNRLDPQEPEDEHVGHMKPWHTSTARKLVTFMRHMVRTSGVSGKPLRVGEGAWRSRERRRRSSGNG